MWDVAGILLKILIVVGITQGAVAYLILLERKVAAWTQDRVGPNRAGAEFALIRPLARTGFFHALVDGAKMILKEDIIPGHVTKPLYILAPCIAIITATIAFAVVPFGPVGPGQVMQFQIAPGIDCRVADWEAWDDPARYDWVIGSDILYADDAHWPLRRIFTGNLAPGGRVLLADPFRSVSLHLLTEMETDDWRVWFNRWAIGEPGAARPVAVYELQPPASA